ncbi:MAG TPA: hypothetical protein P5230_01585 [Candidatus Magasanikbacteria bacterium]|nr:hypothetical protein [Candidatus Magasanikbacteria bacterium]
MDWLEKAKDEAKKNLEKIQQIIQERYDYSEKVEELREICTKSEKEKVCNLFSDADYCLKEWQNGPVLGLNSPGLIISAAENYKKTLDKLIAEINKELFPC